MDSKFRRKLDPLDQALLERAFESVRAAVKKDFAPAAELESDEELEASLQRELVDIALSNGVRDTEALNILVEAFLDTPKKPG